MQTLLYILLASTSFLVGWQLSTTHWSRKARRWREMEQFRALIAALREDDAK